MNTLFAKLSTALILIVGLMGTTFFIVERKNTRLYYEELTQRLNAPIAMYVTRQRQLIENGMPDLDGLAELARRAMVINPTAEIYLLDNDGKILGHVLPEDTLLRDRVDLRPVRALIDNTAVMPIHGDDPRSSSSRKVFSAAEVRSGDKLQGYLYVVLGGQIYEALANDIGSSYIERLSIVAALAIVAAAMTIGLIVFGLLTRRLKILSREMRRVSDWGFETEPEIKVASTGGDEIDQLAHSFLTMSRRIKEQLLQLMELDRRRREFITNISHDLHTPLSAIQGYVETLMIKDHALSNGERKRYLSIARQHIVRLGNLIGDLFELAKLDSASVAPNLEAFSVAELIQDVAQEFQLEADSKDIRLQIDIDPKVTFTVGDIGLIQRVLENLVRNAISFTPKRGEITLSVFERTQAVVVAVSDSGPGIPEEDIPRIFDSFYRSKISEMTHSKSSGLGLAIVKRILDLHDSGITVVSRIDSGTRFEFELPIYRETA